MNTKALSIAGITLIIWCSLTATGLAQLKNEIEQIQLELRLFSVNLPIHLPQFNPDDLRRAQPKSQLTNKLNPEWAKAGAVMGWSKTDRFGTQSFGLVQGP